MRRNDGNQICKLSLSNPGVGFEFRQSRNRENSQADPLAKEMPYKDRSVLGGLFAPERRQSNMSVSIVLIMVSIIGSYAMQWEPLSCDVTRTLPL